MPPLLYDSERNVCCSANDDINNRCWDGWWHSYVLRLSRLHRVAGARGPTFGSVPLRGGRPWRASGPLSRTLTGVPARGRGSSSPRSEGALGGVGKVLQPRQENDVQTWLWGLFFFNATQLMGLLSQMTLVFGCWGPAAIPCRRARWRSLKREPVPWKAGHKSLGLGSLRSGTQALSQALPLSHALLLSLTLLFWSWFTTSDHRAFIIIHSLAK